MSVRWGVRGGGAAGGDDEGEGERDWRGGGGCVGWGGLFLVTGRVGVELGFERGQVS